MRVLRIFADSIGESHFDVQDLAMALQDYAPPAAPLLVSQPYGASRLVVIELPVGWGGDKPHPPPGRQMVFLLSGTVNIVASDGDSRIVGVGDAVLLEDTTGKGHTTSVTSNVPVVAVMVRLE